MGLGRQTGNEVDWQRIAGSIGQIGGALERGGRYQDYKEEREKEALITQAQNKAQTAMQLDVSPEDARTQIKEQTRYQEPGFFGKITGKEGKYERSFAPDVAETGYQRAIDSQIASSDATIKKATQDYTNKFAGMSADEMQNLDTTKMPNPAAATAAKGKYFVRYGKTAEAQKLANEQHKLAREGLYNKFKSAQMTADNLLKDPTTLSREKGIDLMVDATNNLNNTSYKAEKVVMNGNPMIQTFIIYDGKRKNGDTYTPEEYQKVLSVITKEVYYQAFDKNNEFSKKMNTESLDNPDYMANDRGETVRVQTFTKPLGPEFQYLVTTLDGQQHPIQDKQTLIEAGFHDVPKTKPGKDGKGAESKTLTNNLKVLDKALELVKQSGRYNIDKVEGTVTDSAGNEVGPELIREAIALMPQLGVALSTGDVQELLQYLNVPDEGDIAGTLLNTRTQTPAPQQQAINTGNTVNPGNTPGLNRPVI